MLLFGSNGILASQIAWPSVYIVLSRTFLGGFLLLLLFKLGRNRFTFYKYPKDALFLLCSGVAMGASWMFLYEAYAQVGVSVATLLNYCGPVIVMVLSPFVFQEKLTSPKLLGFTAVPAGVLLINGQASGTIHTSGIITGLLSALTYGAMILTNKKAQNITGLENPVVQLLTAFVTVLIWVLAQNGPTFPAIRANQWLYILLLGCFNTAFGCYLYFSSMHRLPVQSVAVLGYMEPLCAVLLSALLLSEHLSPLQLLGAGLIIGGALFGECVLNARR